MFFGLYTIINIWPVLLAGLLFRTNYKQLLFTLSGFLDPRAPNGLRHWGAGPQRIRMPSRGASGLSRGRNEFTPELAPQSRRNFHGGS